MLMLLSSGTTHGAYVLRVDELPAAVLRGKRNPNAGGGDAPNFAGRACRVAESADKANTLAVGECGHGDLVPS